MVINSITGGFEIIANDGTIANFASGEYISITKFPDFVRLFNKLSESNEYYDLYPSQIVTINGSGSGFNTVDLLEKKIIEILQSNSLSSDIEIQRTGKYNGKTAYVFNILGRRSGFTSTSIFNDIKEYDNGVANIPALSNSTLDIISSSANDTSAGTGVRTVKVVYVNNSNQLVESSAITLNGTTLVTSVLTGVNAVLWMETNTVGSGEVAAGNIRLRINGSTVEVEQISIGGNKSMSAFFMVPTGHTAHVKCLHGTAIGTNQDLRLRGTVNTLDRSISNVWHYQDNLFLTTGQIDDSDISMLKFPALSKIKVSTISGATPVANRADVSFQVILIAD